MKINLDSKLTSYSIVATAALATGMLSQNASAAIVYTNLGDVDVPSDGGATLVGINADTGALAFGLASSDSSIISSSGTGTGTRNASAEFSVSGLGNRIYGAVGGNINRLSAGFLFNTALITNSAANYLGGGSFYQSSYVTSSTSFSNGNFVGADNAYMAFNILIGGTLRPAWARISLSGNMLSLTVHDWAYEDDGNSIEVGATSTASVPEPLTLASLAIGVAGLFARRRKKS